MGRLCEGAAVCALLLRCTATLLIASATATDYASILLPDWARRIDQDGLFRLQANEDRAANTAVLQRHEEDETLLEWASRATSGELSLIEDEPFVSESPRPDSDTFLVIGAKTSVLHGFNYRQAIRQTWASAEATPVNVRVVFLGCESDVSMYAEPKREELQRAIALEKRVFGDLLTSELSQCQDSFAHLADKVKAFMHWTARAYPTLAYAMVVDDDVYLRVDLLLELLGTTPRTRFFGGNSVSSNSRGLAKPIRDPRNKYFISSTTYPLSHFPPFVSGALIIVSSDLVEFIARNFKILCGFGTLDDPTLGVWFLSFLQVKPTYIDAFQALRYISTCPENFVSLADLATVSIRQLHANALRDRSMCHGFELEAWTKPLRSIPVPSVDDSSRADTSDQTFRWDPQVDADTKRFQIEVTIAADNMTGAFVYIPATESVGLGFCARASSLLQEKLFVTVTEAWCVHHQRRILASLQVQARERPGLRALTALTRHNLQQSLTTIERTHTPTSKRMVTFTSTEPDPLLVVLSRSAQQLQVLLECLFVALNPESQVLVIRENEWTSITLDVYVACVHELPLTASIHKQARRVVILEHGPTGATAFTQPTWTDQVVQLIVPAASRVFAHTAQHSPMDLLAIRAAAEDPHNKTRRRFAAVTSTCDSTEFAEFEAVLEPLSDFVLFNSSVNRGGDEHIHPRAFPLDQVVEDMKQFQFAFARDAPAMVLSFLAGCIPVYCGPPSTDVEGLFDPRAFVDCSEYKTPRECAERIIALSDSADRIAELRGRPPVVDEVAFTEAFFWHLDANGSHLSEEARALWRRHYERLRDNMQ